MTELRITRSKDIELYIGSEKLFGVTDFRAQTERASYPIREYLSSKPVALINTESKVKIRMSVLSLFRFAVLEHDDFDLSVVDGDMTYVYEGCTVVRHERSVRSGKNVVDEFVIEAKSLRKQVQAVAE